MENSVIDDLEFCHEDDIPRVHSKNNKNLLIRFPKPQPKYQDNKKISSNNVFDDVSSEIEGMQT